MKRREEIMESYSGGSGHYTKKDIKLAATDIKTWIHAPVQIAVVTILYGKFVERPRDMKANCKTRLWYLFANHPQVWIQILHSSGPVFGCSR